MRFKNGLSFKVTPLKTYEIELPKEEVIYRLMEQDGFCRNQDSNGYALEFECFKNGEFLVKDLGRIDRQLFLQGRVVSENEKTVVYVETVKDKSSFVISVVSTAICFLVSIVGCVLMFLNGGFGNASDLLKMVLLLVLPILSIGMTFKQKAAIPVDKEIMLKEIDQRILGVIRWDE